MPLLETVFKGEFCTMNDVIFSAIIIDGLLFERYMLSALKIAEKQQTFDFIMVKPILSH